MSFGERKHGGGSKKRGREEEEEVIVLVMATVQLVSYWLLLWLFFKQGVSVQRMCMQEQRAE